MEARHKAELVAIDEGSAAPADALPPTEPVVAPEPGEATVKKSRAQKRREKKEQKEKEDREERENAPTRHELEMRAFKKTLTPLGLTFKAIPSDGHCMYRALEDQLQLSKEEAGEKEAAAFDQLRTTCAAFMKEHRSDYQPFCLNEKEEVMNDTEFEDHLAYVAGKKKEDGSVLWGGETELSALAKAICREILVYQGTNPDVNRKPRSFCPEGVEPGKTGKPPLRISYHRFIFLTMEHYNSIVPLVEEEFQPVNE